MALRGRSVGRGPLNLKRATNPPHHDKQDDMIVEPRIMVALPHNSDTLLSCCVGNTLISDDLSSHFHLRCEDQLWA